MAVHDAQTLTGPNGRRIRLQAIPEVNPDRVIRRMYGTTRVTLYRGRSAWEQRYHAKVRGRFGRVRTVHAMTKRAILAKLVKTLS